MWVRLFTKGTLEFVKVWNTFYRYTTALQDESKEPSDTGRWEEVVRAKLWEPWCASVVCKVANEVSELMFYVWQLPLYGLLKNHEREEAYFTFLILSLLCPFLPSQSCPMVESFSSIFPKVRRRKKSYSSGFWALADRDFSPKNICFISRLILSLTLCVLHNKAWMLPKKAV